MSWITFVEGYDLTPFANRLTIEHSNHDYSTPDRPAVFSGSLNLIVINKLDSLLTQVSCSSCLSCHYSIFAKFNKVVGEKIGITNSFIFLLL
ncbi:MAG TPA: hypothetical protein VHJ38_09515 [Nitrososphaeraceae archaeon]|nr:hypothetical protein [Nitrososphaeraceae archaeon]